MEVPCAESKEVEERGMEISQHCLSLPPILRQILEHLSTTELIGLSLVSKLWNYEARSVMKKRGKLTAAIRSGGFDIKIRQRRIIAFASYLENMQVVPFSGIHFHMYHLQRRDCQTISNGLVGPFYKVILERIPWKLFSVRFYDEWKHCKHCPALVFVKNVLEDYCDVLEELTLGFGGESFLRTIFPDRSLPHLQSLTIESRDLGSAKHCVTSDFIKTLVSCAPNLQELHVDAGVDLSFNVLEGSSSVLVPNFRLRPLVKPICADLIGSIRTDLLDICIQTYQIDPRLLNRLIPKLLEACRTKLEILCMDLLFALPLMCYGICLENVTTLEIYMNCFALETIQPRILNLTRGLDFTRIFPKLTQVTIVDAHFQNFSADVVSAFVERGNAVLNRALPDRAANVQTLKFDRVISVQPSTLPLLAQIFPDVKTVDVKRTPMCSFLILRQHFRCLEKVIES